MQNLLSSLFCKCESHDKVYLLTMSLVSNTTSTLSLDVWCRFHAAHKRLIQETTSRPSFHEHLQVFESVLHQITRDYREVCHQQTKATSRNQQQRCVSKAALHKEASILRFFFFAQDFIPFTTAWPPEYLSVCLRTAS